VAEQWVCAWLRPHTVCVPSRKSRQDSERLHTWQGHDTLRWPIGRRRGGGQVPVDASPRGREMRLGEDHSECISDQQLQPGVVEEDQPRSPHHPTWSANQRIQWKAAAQGERGRVRVKDPRDFNRSGSGCPGSSITVRPKASRTHSTYGDLLGAAQIGMARAVRRLGPRHHTPSSKTLTALSTDSSIRRSRSRRFVAAAASPAGSGRAITRLPALAWFAPRSLVLDLSDQFPTHLREGMIKVALVGGGHEVRPSA
jgi:hypothetical protein